MVKRYSTFHYSWVQKLAIDGGGGGNFMASFAKPDSQEKNMPFFICVGEN